MSCWQKPPRRIRSGASRATAPKGITVSGQVKNYVPVTDETLRNPDPADWLMARGNYQAWSYSPLAQITAENVKRSATGLGLGDERRRRQRADAHRPRRNYLSHQHQQHPPGA